MAKMQPVSHGISSGEERGFFSVSPLLRLAERLFSARKKFSENKQEIFFRPLLEIGINRDEFELFLMLFF